MRLQEGILGGPAKETGPSEERDLVVESLRLLVAIFYVMCAI